MNALARVFPALFGETHKITAHEAQWLTQSADHSPDLGWLEQFEFQLLFCPDRTQRGHSEYPLIEDSIYGCHAFTQKKFNYWVQRDGQPIPMEATSDVRTNLFPPPLRIKGEVHAIRPWQFKELDNFKNNRYTFTRKRVKLMVPSVDLLKIPDRYENGKQIPLMTNQFVLTEEKVEPLKAWMYVGEPEYWDELLDAGYKAAELFKSAPFYKSRRPWLNEYYEYTQLEIPKRDRC